MLTYAVLKISGVPFAGLIAVFVAIADLIPLVGATLGAVVAAVAAFIHSVPAGIAVIVFFVVYQQLENHLLQPVIFSRTVKLNPLTVLVAILLGVELAGILGALLAIPVAGIIQVVLRDVWDHRRGRPKDEPTVGEDRTPVDHANPDTGPTHPPTRPSKSPVSRSRQGNTTPIARQAMEGAPNSSMHLLPAPDRALSTLRLLPGGACLASTRRRGIGLQRERQRDRIQTLALGALWVPRTLSRPLTGAFTAG